MSPAAAGAEGTGPDVREAAWWRLAALLFERPRGGWREEVEALAGAVADAALAEAARAVAERADEGAYLRALGPGGAASPREVAYRPMEDPGRLLADLAGFYEAFAYRPRAEDPIDHIAVEAGFVGFLKLKEAYAVARESPDDAETTRRALGGFLESHLGAFAASLAERLESAPCGAEHVARVARLVAEAIGCGSEHASGTEGRTTRSPDARERSQ